jgi:hypothetical protein
MRKLLLAFLTLVTAVSYASGAGWLPLVGSIYTGPGDLIASGWVGFYSCRAFNAATKGTKAYRIVRASDSTQTDINSLANGQCDTTTPTTFCASTTCKVVTYYDQSVSGGCTGSCDLTQATDANRPPLTLSALNGWPCIINATSATLASVGGISTLPQPYTWMGIGERFANFGTVFGMIYETGGTVFIGWRETANTFGTQSGTITATASDGTSSSDFTHFHAFAGPSVANTASASSIVVDGAITTGTLGTFTLSSPSPLTLAVGNSSTQGAYFCEGGLQNTAWNTTQIGQICHNQYTVWGSHFPASC